MRAAAAAVGSRKGSIKDKEGIFSDLVVVAACRSEVIGECVEKYLFISFNNSC